MPNNEYVAFKVLIYSLIPSVEGRYALLLGVYEGLSPLQSLLVASVGVLILSLVLPYVLPYLDSLMVALSKTRSDKVSRAAGVYLWYVGRVRRKANRYVSRWGLVGLVVFIAAPLPGTGVWTGALASYLLGVNKKAALVILSLGGLLSNMITISPILLAGYR